MAEQPSELHPNIQRMLRHGGPWDPNETPEVSYKARGTVRSQLGTFRTGLGQELIEPSASVSSFKKTKQILREMWRKGYSKTAAREALEDTNNIGGSHYRWIFHTRTKGESYMDYLWDDLAETETNPSKCVYRSTPKGSIYTLSQSTQPAFTYHPSKVGEILRWIRDNPDASQRTLTEAGIVHPRGIRKYLAHMEEAGLIRSERKHIPGRRGGPAKVWSLTAVKSRSVTTVDEAYFHQLISGEVA